MSRKFRDESTMAVVPVEGPRDRLRPPHLGIKTQGVVKEYD